MTKHPHDDVVEFFEMWLQQEEDGPELREEDADDVVEQAQQDWEGWARETWRDHAKASYLQAIKNIREHKTRLVLERRAQAQRNYR